LKQYLIIVAIELPYREAATAREPAKRVRERDRQVGEIAPPARKGQPARKVLRDRLAQLVHKEVPDSKDLQVHKAPEATRAHPVLRERLARRVSLGKQVLCVMSRGLEMLSHATMAKRLSPPFAKKVLLPFKDPLGPNATHQAAAWLASACGSRRFWR
jgi:hypothetical protein